MKKLITVFSLIILFHRLSLACSCIDTGSFCESIGFLDGITELNYNIVLASVEAQDVEAAVVSVEHSFKGSAAYGEKFTILNGGWMCAIGTEVLEIGKQYIFILEYPASKPQYVSDCGTFYLRVEDGKVKGNITPSIEETSLNELADIVNCGDLRNPTEFYFTVLPTLLTNTGQIRAFPNALMPQTDVSIQVFNANGRLVLERLYQQFMAFEPIEIEVENWSSGVYFIQFNYFGKRQVLKIVKVN